MTISILRLYSAVCCHISVGFLLYYLFYWAMRRPQLVNKQRRSTLFVCMYHSNSSHWAYWTHSTYQTNLTNNNKQQY